MNDTDVIQTLQSRLALPVGRHLYGALGSYPALERFAGKLQQANGPDGKAFPVPFNVNRRILQTIPDDQFKTLVENEPKTPEPIAQYVAASFESFLKSAVKENGMVVLASLEMLFVYNLELNLLRTLATDANRILLLLPGKRSYGKIIMFPELQEDSNALLPGETSYTLPTNLIAEDHLWELSD
jgi:hypothetical protein